MPCLIKLNSLQRTRTLGIIESELQSSSPFSILKVKLVRVCLLSGGIAMYLSHGRQERGGS